MIGRRAFIGGLLAARLPRFRASGFFRLEKRDRWWLAAPDGEELLSFGLNHVAPTLLRRPECVEHWTREFGADFTGGYRAKVRRDLDALGMNTLGVHSSLRDLPPGFVPYLHTVRFAEICHYMTPSKADFPDVFSPEFEQHCDRVSRAEVLPRRDDRSLIAYFFTDCPIFTDRDAAPRGNNIYGAVRPGLPTWPRVLRNLGAESPGKRAWTGTMRERYGSDIGRFNRAYGSAFGSFETLERATDWRDATDPANAAETADNLVFLERVVDRYYRVAVEAVRRYDPNHLIAGDKLNGNTGTPDGLVRLAARHMDLVFYQMYGYWEEQKPLLDRWSRIGGKPLFNGDSSYAVPYDAMPDPYGPHCKDQQERAERAWEFGSKAFARPDFVGWTWCGWMDGLKTQQKDKQHSGLQDPWGRYYVPVTDALRRLSGNLYQLARKR